MIVCTIYNPVAKGGANIGAKRSRVRILNGMKRNWRTKRFQQISITTIRSRLQQNPDHTVHPIRFHGKNAGIVCRNGRCRVFPDLLQTKKSKILI